MHFGFALELSEIDFWNTDSLDTHLDLLSPDKYTDIPSKYFVCFHKIFKTSSRHVFKTSSRHVFKTSSRRLQRNNFSSSKTSWRRLHLARGLENVFKTSSRLLRKTSSRRLQNVLEDVKLLRWRLVEDVFNTCLEDVLKTSSKPTNVCWDRNIT